MIGGGSLGSDKFQRMPEWLSDMGTVYEALTTGQQEIYVYSDLSQWAGIHIVPGEEVTFERTFTFKIVGRESE